MGPAIACHSLAEAFDGTFSEGAALNSVAWTGLRQPTILWTYGLSDDVPALDAFFQQHLLMDVFPMAPMPKNDHSITPGSEIVEQAYRDYAPLFDAMHGARWLLSTRPLSLSVNSSATPASNLSAGVANVFTITANASQSLPLLLVPVVLADAAVSAVTLRMWLAPTASELGWPEVGGLTVFALYPGASGEAPLGDALHVDGAWEIRVPLKRRSAVVKVHLR